MNRRLLLILGVVVCAGLLGVWYFAHRPKGAEKELAQLIRISEGIRRASALTLYEGLPHPTWEADQLQKELATKQTVRFHDFPFYERPLLLAVGEVEPLRQLSAAASSYAPYSGSKFCGAYHPDYGLAWKDGETTYLLLICLGCHEMKIYGPKTELTVDITKEAFKSFEAALQKHREQRP